MSQPDKYSVSTDTLSGRITANNRRNGDSQKRPLDIRFGFRNCKDGERSICVWVADLAPASEGDKQLWAGFQLNDEELSEAPDPRYENWVRQNIDGEWDASEGPIASVDRLIRSLNAITACVVNHALYTSNSITELQFPSADNNHRYHDAHGEAYKYLIDGLNKEAIVQLGARLGIPLKCGDKATLTCLRKLLPERLHAVVVSPLDLISEQRRNASHKDRPQVTAFPAFEQFSEDLASVTSGFEALRDYLTEKLDVDAQSCEDRLTAIRRLPVIDPERPAHEADFAITRAKEIVGKRVTAVRVGYRKPLKHQSDTEVIILEFDDGSMLGIDPCSDIGFLTDIGEPVNADALHITLWTTFVNSVRPFKGHIS